MIVNSATRELVQLRTGRELPELLRELWIERRWTHTEIARALGVSRYSVVKWCQEFGIELSERSTVLDPV